MENSDRRSFLRSTACGVATAAALQSVTAMAGQSQKPVTVGLIGCGGRGNHDLQLFRDYPDVKVAWVCDADAERLSATAKRFGIPADHAVTDMRRLLDDKSLDAVIVATPDHWH